MNRWPAIISVLLFLALLVVGSIFLLNNKKLPPTPSDKRLVVLTTILPLQEFAAFVGGEQVLVISLLPAGAEVHHFELRPSDLKRLQEADLFIYGGEILEPGVAKILSSLESKTLEVLDASQVSILLTGNDEHLYDEEGGNHENDLEAIDPHFWLDFENDQKIISVISEQLSILDPEHASLYSQRASEYQDKLKALDITYQTSLENCQSREFIYGGHSTFAYLAKRYNLNYLAAQGVSPDAEPGAQTLILLSQQAQAQSSSYIFYEEWESSKVAETIASESGAKLKPLNSGHNLSPAQKEAGLTFIEIMENNLSNLRQGLNCQ